MKNIKLRDYTDYPFENISIMKWIRAMIISSAGFAVIFFLGYFPVFMRNQFTASVLFTLFNLLALYSLDRRFFRKIFKPLKLMDILTVAFSVVITFAIAFIISIYGRQNLENNPVVDIVNRSNFFLISIPIAIQLIGEEIIFVIPFLMIYNILKNKNRIFAIAAAYIISSVFFGLMHLTTYNFNLYQCLVVITGIRMGISTGYLISKNLTVSYLSHLIYDLLIIMIYIFAV